MTERRFTEQQVADIIRKASETQNVRRSVQGESGSITASELRRIAAELGIDPDAIEEAMGTTVSWTTVETGSEFPAQRFYERRIPGALSVASYAEVMGAIPPSRWLGSVSVRGDGLLSYKARVGFTSCHVTLANYGQGSRLRVRCSGFGTWVASLACGFFLWFLVYGTQAGFYGPPFEYFLFLLLMILTATGFVTPWIIRHSQKKVTRLMNEAAANLEERWSAQPVDARVGSALHDAGRMPSAEESRLEHRMGGA